MRRLTPLVLLLIAGTTRAASEPRSIRELVAAATVRLASGCSGVVAEMPQIVVTALHCVDGHDTVGVRFGSGDERTAHVAATAAASDQAVLVLEPPASVAPLRIARRRQIPGTVLYYFGHPDRVAFQTARLDRIGQCPSLPALQNALFTSIRGKPGDSGAPLVNAAGEIVGLVHGGAACQIATPAETLLPLVERVGADIRRRGGYGSRY